MAKVVDDCGCKVRTELLVGTNMHRAMRIILRTLLGLAVRTNVPPVQAGKPCNSGGMRVN